MKVAELWARIVLGPRRRKKFGKFGTIMPR
jgi:hypothetical protein